MRIYAVSVVQNEADVIRESLAWALRFCDRIWVWDLGSTDGTWPVLESMSSERIIARQHPGLRFTSALKGKVFAEARSAIEDGSWVYILDADEFLAGDPTPVLAAAEEEGVAQVGAWQANFFPTRKDLERLRGLGEAEWLNLPLFKRFRDYRVEWFEWRFIRVSPGLVWDTSGAHSQFRDAAGNPLKRSRRQLLVRHYRYRSPRQVAERFNTRKQSPPPGYGQFRYETAADFASYVRPAWQCRHWPEDETDMVVPRTELWRARVTIMAARILRRMTRR